MTFQEFIATRQQTDDLRQFPECPYGERNNEPDSWPEPVKGFAYLDGCYAIEELADGAGFRVFIQFEEDYADLLSAELQLFYYYGMSGAPRPIGELTLWERLEMACRTSNLDNACRYIQDGIGQDDGGLAGQYFSDPERDDDAWPNLDLRQRFEVMREYIAQELNEVDARLTDPESATAAFIPQESK